MRITTRVALAACVALGALTPASANHSWGNYHWARTSNPLVLRINTSLTGNWAGYVSTAITDWDKSTVIDFDSRTPNPVTAGTKKCNPIGGQILVCNDLYGQRGWLGIASIWASGSHITQATTKLNDTYFNMARYSSAEWRQFVACQEIGHDFGLDHQDENFSNTNLGTCMDYTNNPAGGGTNGSLKNTAPDSHDLAQLASIYSHTDSTNTASGAIVTNFGLRQVGKPVPQQDAGVGDTMADWGQAIHQDGKGRPDVFVRQLADGRKVITHVLWAPDAKGTEAH
jgi:hypothetical protein